MDKVDYVRETNVFGGLKPIMNYATKCVLLKDIYELILFCWLVLCCIYWMFSHTSNVLDHVIIIPSIFQQFVVDGYTMMDSERLFYIKIHQKQLQVDKYNSLLKSQDQNQ